MTTEPKKGLYWYIALVASLVLLPMSIAALILLKNNAIAGTFWENWKEMLNAMIIIALNASFFSDLYKYKEGYTTVVTTQYKLFKCRQSGEENSFMMFADTEEELEKFFEITHPDKKFFIEPAEMTGKSIQMRVFHPTEQ